MKKTNEIEVVLEYNPSDIKMVDDEYFLERATINGYDEPAPDWLLEIANEDAMFCNQLEQEYRQEQHELGIGAEEHQYDRKVEALANAIWSAL